MTIRMKTEIIDDRESGHNRVSSIHYSVIGPDGTTVWQRVVDITVAPNRNWKADARAAAQEQEQTALDLATRL